MQYTEYLEKIKGFSFKTIEIYNKYAQELEQFDRDYKTMLISKPKYSSNTRRLIVSAIISYYKFLKDERWRELELPKKEVIVKDYIAFDEYKEMLKSINTRTKMGLQKRLVIRLLFETGIRSEELLNIKKKDIDGNEIKIFGKGKRQRIVKISEWLKEELEIYAKDKEHKLFNFQYKNLYSKVQSLSRDKKITPHMFRRGYAKYCFEKGVSIYDISLSMGHSSIETTAGYIKRDSEDVEIFKIF